MSEADRHAVAAGTVFDGSRLHHDCAVVIEGTASRRSCPGLELPAAIPVQTLPEGAWLAPGFIDTQVNGGGDVLFNDDADPRWHCRHRSRASALRDHVRCCPP